MSYLLDTRALIWAINKPDILSLKVKNIIENPNNEILVSSITFWGISVKYSLGKLNLDGLNPDELRESAEKTGFLPLPLFNKEATSYHLLNANWHRDPFDRMLIWQAISNNLTLISKDKTIAQYQSAGLKTIW